MPQEKKKSANIRRKIRVGKVSRELIKGENPTKTVDKKSAAKSAEMEGGPARGQGARTRTAVLIA